MKISIRVILKYILRAMIAWMAVMAIVLTFMTLASCIRRDSALGQKIVANVEESMYIWSEDTTSPMVHNAKWYQAGNGDDMMLANMAITDVGGSAFYRAMTLHFYWTPDDETGFNGLVEAMYYQDSTNVGEYSRFYMMIGSVMKLMFIVYDIVEIRMLLYFVTMILSTTIIYLLHKELGWRGVIPFVTACAFRLIIAHGITFNAFSDIFIGFVGTLIVLLCYKKKWFRDSELIVFGIIGMVAYINCMLYAPLFTLGMPLVITVLLDVRHNDRSVSSWIKIFGDSICWVIGYSSALVAKMVISRVILGYQTASDEMSYMMGLDMTIEERFAMIKYVIDGIFEPYNVKMPLLIALVAVLVVLLIRNGFKLHRSLGQIFVLSLYPFVWIMIICRHSQHNLVANIMCMWIFALVSAICLSIGDKKSSSTEE